MSSAGDSRVQSVNFEASIEEKIDALLVNTGMRYAQFYPKDLSQAWLCFSPVFGTLLNKSTIFRNVIENKVYTIMK